MNAVYELVTREAQLPTARGVYRAGAVAGLLITAYLIWETLYRWPERFMVGGMMYPGALVIILLIPPIAAAISGVVTAHHARRIDFALLRTTPQTPMQIAWGFLSGAIYHNRIVLAIGITMLPVLSIGWMQYNIDQAYHLFTTCGMTCAIPPSIIDYSFDWYAYDDFVRRSLAELVMASAMGATAIPAASVGVWSGISSRNKFLAGTVAFIVAVNYPLAAALVGFQLDMMEIHLNLSLPVFALVYLFGFCSIGAVVFLRTLAFAERLRENLASGDPT